MPIEKPVFNLSIRMPQSMHQEVVAQASKEHASMNSWILRLIDAALRSQNQKEPAHAN